MKDSSSAYFYLIIRIVDTYLFFMRIIIFGIRSLNFVEPIFWKEAQDN